VKKNNTHTIAKEESKEDYLGWVVLIWIVANIAALAMGGMTGMLRDEGIKQVSIIKILLPAYYVGYLLTTPFTISIKETK
jgi:hypothetical protein